MKICKNIERVKGRNLSIVVRRVKTGGLLFIALETRLCLFKVYNVDHRDL